MERESKMMGHKTDTEIHPKAKQRMSVGYSFSGEMDGWNAWGNQLYHWLYHLHKSRRACFKMQVAIPKF